jgi:hypothetical protein
MLGRIVASAAVLLAVVGVVIAEPVRGLITSVAKKDDKYEIKINVRKKGEKKGEAKTFTVKEVEVFKATGKKGSEPEKSTVEAITEAIKNAKAKGVPGSVDVDGDKAKVTYFARKKKSDS